jgi:hypothetical protein
LARIPAGTLAAPFVAKALDFIGFSAKFSFAKN